MEALLPTQHTTERMAMEDISVAGKCLTESTKAPIMAAQEWVASARQTENTQCFTYQNVISVAPNGFKFTDNECQKVGRHFFSVVKNSPQHCLTLNGVVA